ncbi:archease [Pseudomonas oryzae]|uniref:SHS2 domain-containing protein n=1 Tax=Pseudomonas oryzae TaxID=1392877 RepID=A0A1H1YBJ5_9PSED|nr:archease [Pseudomonas oryzae]SDT18734.1 SHS2 domain-containing protein [Pseudomonas oryzae]
MPWQTFPHEADIGVRGSGATLEEAFAGAALALTAAICDPASVMPKQSLTIDCAAPDLELLLVDWLNALIYRMATRHLLFSRFEIRIDGTRLHASAWGEAVDVARHQPAAEAKGVSFCELKVCQQADGSWLAQAVVDV